MISWGAFISKVKKLVYNQQGMHIPSYCFKKKMVKKWVTIVLK